MVKAKVVLLVDDSELVLAKLSEIVINSGYTVITASSGEAALDLIEREGRPDIVVTDVTMPGMDGRTLCRTLRERFPRPHLPVIMLTSDDGQSSELAGFNAGADEYLVKDERTDLKLPAQLYRLLNG